VNANNEYLFCKALALSIFMFGEISIEPQERAAHTDAQSTKIYMKDHVEWIRVQAAELAV
jgi:hypothetical protein